MSKTPPSTKILLIDDDEQHSKLLQQYLQKFGFDLVYALDADSGIPLLKKEDPSLLLLDVMLPGKDGFEVCREVRKFTEIPIIMLTARGDVIDRVSGLELGADDYVGKPFEPRELVARMNSLLRRAGSQSDNSTTRLAFDGLEFDLDARVVYLDGEQVELTSMEYELFVLLATNPGKKLSRDEILSQLRGVDAMIMTRSVDIMISRLRAKLNDTRKPPRFIQTVWGRGYVFVGKRSIS